ncbi:MAG TPA: lamin tail domain-containing protein [Candidatus Sulfomarinibacteraceae bacterium]|nr:lamin tail domain-containing protein [Candidatus Sulfomarinibacteraceae bacterium]
MLYGLRLARSAAGVHRRVPTLLIALLFCFLAADDLLDNGSAALAQPDRQTASGLLITEVYYDTPGPDEDEEWIELANVGELEISLAGYGLGDEEQAGGGEGMVRFPPGASIGPGEVIVVAQTATGFQRLFGQRPDYEISDSDPDVPDMEKDAMWATGSLGLNNSGDEVLLIDAQDALVDAVSYGDSTFFFTPAVGSVPRGHSIERAPANCDSDSAADWKPASSPTPGQVLLAESCLRAPDLLVNGEAPSIGVIQGRGDRSPLVNELVTFRGIVTGVQEDRNARGVIFYTMFVQDSPEMADGDPNTSDAIPVFLARRRPPAQPGDEVLVTGRVIEFYGLTEIDYRELQVQILSTGNELPVPVSLVGKNDSEALEALEGMRVSLPPAPVVGPTFTGCGFAVAPDAGPTPRVIRQSAGEDSGFVVPILYQSDVDCRGLPQVKVGDVVEGLSGPLTYHFDEYKIVLQSIRDVTVHAAPLPELPSPPALAPGEFSVATFNLYDYFDPIDDTGTDAEPKPSIEEVQRKQRKLSKVIGDVLGCPTLLGVQEVENEALLLQLADLLHAHCGFRYEVSHRESADARGIDVALLSQPQRVVVHEAQLRQACAELPVELPVHATQAEAACGQGGPPLFSRPPLVVDLMLDQRPYTIYVNHFKSKREGEAETAPRRQAQAAFVRALVDEQLAQDTGVRLIVMGDFNDYPRSAPLDTLINGYTPGSAIPLHDAMLGVPLEQRYTYIFSGVSQLLDTILLSPALAERVSLATIAHVNADYPVGMATDGESPFHASDHDAPLVVLQGADVAPSPTPVTATETPAARPETQTPVPSVSVAETTTPEAPTPQSAPTEAPQAEVVPSPAITNVTAESGPSRGHLLGILLIFSFIVLMVAVGYVRGR